jgi:NTP pyrophosphatase (non-canonical NTP hydrolase)
MEDSIVEMTRKAIQFREARDWRQFHDPKNLAEAICIESGELLENFLWSYNDKSHQVGMKKIQQVEEEIADIMIFLLYLCQEFNIDLRSAVERKIEKNENKYPVEKAKGSSKKYKEL